MAADRLEVLRSMVDQNPDNSFTRYGLAMEYVNRGDLDTAVEQFRILLQQDPNYPAAYFHGGQTLEKLGRPAEAKTLYREGMDAATRAGDMHTRSELEAALASLG